MLDAKAVGNEEVYKMWDCTEEEWNDWKWQVKIELLILKN